MKLNEIIELINGNNYSETYDNFTNYFLKNPDEVEGKFYFALFLSNSEYYIDDYEEALNILDSILTLNLHPKLYVRSLLLKAFIEDKHYGQIKIDTHSLISMLDFESNDKDIEFFQLSLFDAQFYKTNSPEFEVKIRKSILLDYSAVYNRILYARHILFNRNLEEYKKYFLGALNNIIKVYSIAEIKSKKPNSFMDFSNLINEFLRGTHINYIIYESLLKEFDDVTKKW